MLIDKVNHLRSRFDSESKNISSNADVLKVNVYEEERCCEIIYSDSSKLVIHNTHLSNDILAPHYQRNFGIKSNFD